MSLVYFPILRRLGSVLQMFLMALSVAPAFAAAQPPTNALERIQLDPICARIASPNPGLAPGNPSPGTAKMAQRLAELGSRLKPGSAPFANDQMVEMLKSRAANARSTNELLDLQFQLAVQQLNSARPDESINTFNLMEYNARIAGRSFDEQSRVEIRHRKALAFFRLGELENCLASHNEDSCLFPIPSTARHQLPRGARTALNIYKSQLEEYPGDLGARWLLNIAHMALGEYPDKVDPKYVIPPEQFASEYTLPRFRDVSAGLGLDANDLAGGCILDDFDNDGLDDVVISAWDFKGQLRFFKNAGDGTFIERTSEAGLVGEVASLNIQQTDYNNDGYLDIWATRGAWLGDAGRIPNSLLRNNKDGTFSDVTEEAGLLSFHPTQASRWFDFDGDGWLDLFIGNETTNPNRPEWCELFRNNRDGTFTECAHAVGIRVAEFVKGVACADYDNDGRPDLFLSVRGNRPKILLHNDGPDASGMWRFSDRAREAGVDDRLLSFATFFFDYNNDGWQDLFVSGYYLPNGIADVAADYLGRPNNGEKPRLFLNNGDSTFKDVTREARLDRICHTMGHNYGDLDNDGWLDFYCGTGDPDLRTLLPNRMFRNNRGRNFQDVTATTGTGHLQKGHGIAFADLDGDGFQEIYSSLGGAYTGDYARNALFLNPAGNGNHWIKLRLEGTRSNRPAIGAKIRVQVATPDGTRELHRVVSSGGSFGSNPLRQEIGLGNATRILEVEIQWPGSGTRQQFNQLAMDSYYHITEADPQPRLQKIQVIPMGGKNLPSEDHGSRPSNRTIPAR